MTETKKMSPAEALAAKIAQMQEMLAKAEAREAAEAELATAATRIQEWFVDQILPGFEEEEEWTFTINVKAGKATVAARKGGVAERKAAPAVAPKADGTELRWEQAARLRQAGLTNSAIAAEMGISSTGAVASYLATARLKGMDV